MRFFAVICNYITIASCRGKTVCFVTNNATNTCARYKKKFDSFRLDIPPEEIFRVPSLRLPILLLGANQGQGEWKAGIQLFGEVGICEELDLIDARSPTWNLVARWMSILILGPSFVVGFGYHKIQYVQLLHQRRGSRVHSPRTWTLSPS
jgi:ribonucleotide monophosphatase NagD (HAD superfamily)